MEGAFRPRHDTAPLTLSKFDKSSRPMMLFRLRQRTPNPPKLPSGPLGATAASSRFRLRPLELFAVAVRPRGEHRTENGKCRFPFACANWISFGKHGKPPGRQQSNSLTFTSGRFRGRRQQVSTTRSGLQIEREEARLFLTDLAREPVGFQSYFAINLPVRIPKRHVVTLFVRRNSQRHCLVS